MSDWHKGIDCMFAAMRGGRTAWWHSYVASVRIYQHHVDWEPRWWAWVACVPNLPRSIFNGVPRFMRWEMAAEGER